MPISDSFCKQCHIILMKKPGPEGLCPRCEEWVEKRAPARGPRKRRAKSGDKDPRPMREFKLEEECGVTMVSIRNADIICEALGAPDNVLLVSGGDTTEHEVVAVWDEGADGAEYTHTFTGFSWGYSGAGVQGLKKFARLIGLDNILSMGILSSLPQNVKGTVLSLARTGWKVEVASPEAKQVLP